MEPKFVSRINLCFSFSSFPASLQEGLGWGYESCFVKWGLIQLTVYWFMVQHTCINHVLKDVVSQVNMIKGGDLGDTLPLKCACEVYVEGVPNCGQV